MHLWFDEYEYTGAGLAGADNSKARWYRGKGGRKRGENNAVKKSAVILGLLQVMIQMHRGERWAMVDPAGRGFENEEGMRCERQ